MNEEMLTEVQEMVIGFMEKLSTDKASKEAQQQLQKKYGNGWNVIIGKGYGAAVTAVKVNIFGLYEKKLTQNNSGQRSTVLLSRRVRG